MKEKIRGIWDKICAGATVAGEFAAKTAENVGNKATDVYNSSKTNLKILDLTTDVEVIYKEIGKIIYAAHTNEDASTEDLDAHLLAIDEKNAQIEELRASLGTKETSKVCSSCGKENPKDSNFCASCGAALEE